MVSEWKLLALLAIVSSMVGLGCFLFGAAYGWQQRVYYEVKQCADYNRCFHLQK